MKYFICLVYVAFIANVFAWVKEMENPGLYEGDMILSPEQRKQVNEGTFFFGSLKDKNKLWPDAVVPYEISIPLEREIEAVSEINKAIEQYNKYTCIRLVKRSSLSEEKRKKYGYIYFYQGGGCSSQVGFGGYQNRVSLSKGCWWRTTIMHEIAHSLGFHHEQSRPDRDQYINVLSSNIHQGTEHNFKKQSYQRIDSLGTAYDYRSMMHYSWNAFGKDGKMTIQTLDASQQYEIGQRDGFSHTDIEQINKLYNCNGTYPTLPPYVKPPKGCYNLVSSCAKHAYQGNCNKREWKTFLHAKCRRTCGLCGGGTPPPTQPPVVTVPTQPPIVTLPTQPPIVTVPPKTSSPITPTSSGDCRDIVDDCRSVELGLDKCTDYRNYWVAYMKKHCRKFCNFC